MLLRNFEGRIFRYFDPQPKPMVLRKAVGDHERRDHIRPSR
jgi:hypothetical protein